MPRRYVAAKEGEAPILHHIAVALQAHHDQSGLLRSIGELAAAMQADHNASSALIATGVIDVHRLTGTLDLSQTLAEQSERYTDDAHAMAEEARGMIFSMSARHESEILVQHGPFVTYYGKPTTAPPPSSSSSSSLITRENGLPITTTRQDAAAAAAAAAVVRTIVSPPCVNGEDNCVGMARVIPGFTEKVPGVVLMAFITEQELNRLRATGIEPVDWKRRGCVLCVRRAISQCIINQMTNSMLMPSPLVIQPWFNPTGIPGSYKLECVHPACASSSANGDGIGACTNGLVAPFARFLVQGWLLAVPPGQGMASGLWRIDQSAMIVRKQEPDLVIV